MLSVSIRRTSRNNLTESLSWMQSTPAAPQFTYGWGSPKEHLMSRRTLSTSSSISRKGSIIMIYQAIVSRLLDVGRPMSSTRSFRHYERLLALSPRTHGKHEPVRYVDTTGVVCVLLTKKRMQRHSKKLFFQDDQLYIWVTGVRRIGLSRLQGSEETTNLVLAALKAVQLSLLQFAINSITPLVR